MNTEPKITIVTPSYNQGQFIEETILSVLNQTYKNIEYIVADGGSTDNTMDIVNKYKDRIDIIIHEKDKGQSDAINKGFKLATGELVGWLNSDDIIYENCVEKIVETYNKNNDGVIYFPCELDYIAADGTLLQKRISKITDKNYLLNYDYDVIQQGSFYKNETLKKVGYVDENIYYCMDLDLWLKLLNHGPIYYYDGPALAAIRRWGDTKTSLSGDKFIENIRVVINAHNSKKFSRTQVKIRYIKLRIILGRVKRMLLKKN
jgi:glycosyltransferase involved in cell wall biosynthesis